MSLLLAQCLFEWASRTISSCVMGFSAQQRATKAALVHFWVPFRRGYLRKQEIGNQMCVPFISSEENLSISAYWKNFFFLLLPRTRIWQELKKKKLTLNAITTSELSKVAAFIVNANSVPRGRITRTHALNLPWRTIEVVGMGLADRQTWICIWVLPFSAVLD